MYFRQIENVLFRRENVGQLVKKIWVEEMFKEIVINLGQLWNEFFQIPAMAPIGLDREGNELS